MFVNVPSIRRVLSRLGLGFLVAACARCGGEPPPREDPAVPALQRDLEACKTSADTLQRELSEASSKRESSDAAFKELARQISFVCAAAKPPPGRPSTDIATLPVPPIETMLHVDVVSVGLHPRSLDFEAANEGVRQRALEVGLSTYLPDTRAYPWDEFWVWREVVLDRVREHLRSPVRLWATYQRLKPAGLATAGKATAEELANLKRALARLEQLFSIDVPPQAAAASATLTRKEAAAHEWCVPGVECNNPCYEQYHVATVAPARDALEQAVAGTPFGNELESRVGDSVQALTSDGVAILQWRLRRQREGGAALVSTWARIFRDARVSLDQVKPAAPAPSAP